MSAADVEQGLAEGARWEFYDSWEAFPHNRVRNDDASIIGEFNLGLHAKGGGTHGEWAIVFYRFRSDSTGSIAARLQAFGDSWAALHASGLVPALAALDDEPQGPDEIRQVLADLGFTDVTTKLRGTHPVRCLQCHGSGYLDNVRPGDPR